MGKVPSALSLESHDIPMFVTWAHIDAAVRPFRDGFVDAFLKYKNVEIHDDDGNTIGMVDQKTFADHFGIKTSTFNGWLEARGQTRKYKPRQKDSDTESRPPEDTDAWIKREVSDTQGRLEEYLKGLEQRSAEADPATVAERVTRRLETDKFELRQRVERRRFEDIELPQKIEAARAAAERGDPLPEPEDLSKTLGEVIAEASEAA